MPKQKDIALDEQSRRLLEGTAQWLIPMLSDDEDLRHVRESAFDYYNKETGEHFQVHVLVTRDKSDFLEFLQTEVMR